MNKEIGKKLLEANKKKFMYVSIKQIRVLSYMHKKRKRNKWKMIFGRMLIKAIILYKTQ